MSGESRCEQCGGTFRIGDWPFCPHGPSGGMTSTVKGFEPYFDIGLGRYVTGWGDIRKGMREEGLDFRDHPSKGEIAARVDKRMAIRRRAGRPT